MLFFYAQDLTWVQKSGKEDDWSRDKEGPTPPKTIPPQLGSKEAPLLLPWTRAGALGLHPQWSGHRYAR